MYLRRCVMRNFGDDLNTLLINSFHRGDLINVNQSFVNRQHKLIYMFIGSVLMWADQDTIVWGTGYMSERSHVRARPKKICAVRGKLTRSRLIKQGFECPEIYGDPSLLLPRFIKADGWNKFKLGIMPHYVDQGSVLLHKFRNRKNVLFINARWDVKKIINAIIHCERIASSSLHGVIVADAYGIPSIWIKLSERVLGKGFKFRDYFSSVNRKINVPLVINSQTTLKTIFDRFVDYKIDIDLDKLYKSCPLIKK